MFNRKRKLTPTIAEAVQMTGLSEDELGRRFMENLLQKGINPFKDLPEQHRRECEEKYPDLMELARRKFGTVY